MEKIGIVCEYNPFHNGHLYHLNKIKELYPDSIVILVLNGYFLQRGEISIISKYDKCELSLQNGVDIVVELPTIFGTQSADTFAYTSIYYLNELQVDRIIFGSETNDINKLKMLANISEDKKYNEKVKELLDKGANYPTALAKAMKVDFDFNPNDLLGISYIKAINKINAKIIPESIKRTNDYHDTSSNNDIISASNIRNKIENNINIDNYLPDQSKSMIKKIDYDLYFKILKSIIIRDNTLEEILDVDEGIENRLKEKIIESHSISEFISKVKTKRYTYNKINRMLIHILLGLKKEDAKNAIDYLKIIGMNKIGQKYLNSIKKDIQLPLNVNKHSLIYQYETKAVMLYDMLTNSNEAKKELSNKPIIY